MSKTMKQLPMAALFVGAASYLAGMYYSVILWVMISIFVIGLALTIHHRVTNRSPTQGQRATRQNLEKVTIVSALVVAFFLKLGPTGLASFGAAILVIMMLIGILWITISGGGKK